MPRLFVDNLTVIDCSILDPTRGLIGASWIVNIELLGQLDQQSMVFDFAKVKKTIKAIIDFEVDHKLLVPANYSGITIIESPIKPSVKKKSLELHFESQRSAAEKKEIIHHHSPTEAVCQIPTERVSRKTVIAFLNAKIMASLPNNVQQINIELLEESTQGNYYRYSHGLKKHDGNCQRIAHGHRSQIQIWQDSQRNSKLEKHIAHLWHDIYLASAEDVTAETNDRITCEYSTEQGTFKIDLPKHRVHIMPCDSTVECIAEHIVDLIVVEQPNPDLKVKAFEGVGKGAIATTLNQRLLKSPSSL